MKRTMEGSTMGDYSARLRVCRTAAYAIGSREVMESEPERAERARACRAAATGAVDFYALMEPRLSYSLSEKTKQTKKELKDLVDICKWEGKEYQAVAQSLERAQRQLVKYAKAFDTDCKVKATVMFPMMLEQAVRYVWNTCPKDEEEEEEVPDKEKKAKEGKEEDSDKAVAAAALKRRRKSMARRKKAKKVAAAAAAAASTEAAAVVKRDYIDEVVNLSASVGDSVLAKAAKGVDGMAEEGSVAEDLEGIADFFLSHAARLRRDGAKKSIKRRALMSCVKLMQVP